MNLLRASKLAAPIVMALCLNGCIAAALPALAGAAMARSGGNQDDSAEDGETVNALNAASASKIADSAAPAMVAASTPDAPTNAIIGAAPPPDNEAQGVLSNSPRYAELIAYAREKAASPQPSGARLSAVLRDPSSLNGKRKECQSDNPVVLIDIDPHEGQNTPESAGNVAPALSSGLQSLRDSDVSIAWISERSAAKAGDIRAALTRTGLDPQSEDRLILMRYPGDRKQTRREELAKESCILAIAGDHRADFDELFEYLVNPESALGLELLIGEGWFLVPPVLGNQEK